MALQVCTATLWSADTMGLVIGWNPSVRIFFLFFL
jgi:hypothetical protein